MITPFGELPNRLAVDMSLAEQHDWLQRRITRRSAIGAGLVGAGAVAVPWLWSRPAYGASAADVYGQHVSYGRDPATELVFRFACANPVQKASVTAASSSGHHVSADVSIESVAGSAARYCRATLSGLHSDTSYTATVTVDGQALAPTKVQTPPATAHPFRFTAFGDQGTSADAHLLLAQQAALAPQFHVFTGDIAYADQTGQGGAGDTFIPRLWDSWLRQNGPYFGATPWMFAVGNHEMEPGFDLHGYAGVLARVSIGGTSPIGAATAGQYQVGTVGFIALDGNDVSYELAGNRGWTGGAQTAWLQSTLQAMRAPGSGIDFVVAYLHQSPYSTNTAHGSDGGVRDEWVPLFDRYSVDLVLSGHNHCYERTLPLRSGHVVSTDTAAVHSQTGTTYIVAGGGGQQATPLFAAGGSATTVIAATGRVTEAAPWSVSTRTGSHALVCVDVTPAATGQQPTMHVRAIDETGVTIDQVLLTRSAAAARPPAVKHAGTSIAWPAAGIGGAAVLAAGGVAAWRIRPRAVAAGAGGE